MFKKSSHNPQVEESTATIVLIREFLLCYPESCPEPDCCQAGLFWDPYRIYW